MCAEARRKMSAQRPAGSMRFRCMLLVTRFNGDEFSSDVGDSRFGSFSEVDARIGEVCFAPINGLRQSGLSGPFRAMCGRLRVGKSFFHILQRWSVQPCVRPFSAVHMTAGHNALRGSGPGHVWTAPCWQELFSRFAALVGAAMCSAF